MTTPQQANLLAFQGRIASNSLTAADIALLTSALSNIIPNWPTAPDAIADAPGVNANLDEWFALLYPEALGLVSGSGGGPVVPASWLVPAWFIDPVAGSDLNNGQTILTPLKTWAQLVNLWGTVAPTLRQNTTITFLSSQPDNTDPVIFRPVLGAGSIVKLTGVPTVVTSGVVLAGVVAKNRATETILQANLGATGAIGQMVVNTTAGKSSRAFVQKLVAGTTFQISQPIAPIPVPQVAPASEVDTWAIGDTVNLLTFPNVALVDLAPTIADAAAAQNNQLYVTQLNAFSPAPASAPANPSPFKAGQGVILQEMTVNRGLHLRGFAGAPILANFLNNLFCSTFVDTDGGGTISIVAGAFTGGIVLLRGDEIEIDGDAIFSGELVLTTQESFIGAVCIDVTGSLTIQGWVELIALTVGGAAALWGAGTLAVNGQGRLQYPAGAGAAAASLLINGGNTINGSGTAHSVIAGAPDVYNGGITITAAHLDAAAGAAGFGGNAFVPGGGAIANTP